MTNTFSKKIILAFLVFLFGQPSSFCSSIIDSLNQVLEETTQKENRIEIQIQISDQYRLSDIEASLSTARECYELAFQTNNKPLQIASGFALVNSLMYQGNFDEALKVTNDLLSLSTKINDRISLADAHSLAGSLQRRKGNSNMTLIHYDSCMSISTQRNYQLGVAKAEIGYGEYKEREGKYLESFENYNRALEITRSEPNRDIKLEMLTLKKIAFAHRYLTEYNKSLELFLKILQHFESVGDEVKVADLYNNIASVYWDIENDEKALEYWKSAIDLAKKTKNRDALANAYQGINVYYRFYGKIDEAEKYCLLDLQMRKEMGDIRGLTYSYKNIGRTYQHKGDLESAKKYLLEGLKYAEIVGQELKLAWMHVQIGRLLNEMNQPGEAITHFNFAIEITQKIRALREESFAYEEMAVSFSKLGQMDRAYEAQKRFTSLKTELLNEKLNQETVRMQTLYETQKRDDQIASLEKESLLQSELIQQSKVIRNLSLTGVTLLLGIVGILFFRSKEKQRINNILSLKNKEIEEQNEIINESLEQKEILLKEIHHRVKNNLQIISSLLNLQSKKIKDDQVLDSINEGRNRVEAMSLIHQNLYQNEDVSNINMQNYLEQLMNFLSSSFQTADKSISHKVKAENILFDIDTAIPIGLITNELVTNAYKHAFRKKDDGQIEIKLIGDNDRYTLKVMDNGIGMNEDLANGRATSLGMKLVKSLGVKQLKGELQISNHEGACVALSFKELNKAN